MKLKAIFICLVFLILTSGCLVGKDFLIIKQDANISDLNIVDFNITGIDTNASTECTGLNVLNGSGSCVPLPSSTIDTNASTECTGLNVLNGSGSCVPLPSSTTDTTLDTNVSAETSWLAKDHVWSADNNFTGETHRVDGNLTDGVNSLTVSDIKDSYDKRVDTWGFGLQFTDNNASVDLADLNEIYVNLNDFKPDTTLDTNVSAETSWLSKPHEFSADQNIADSKLIIKEETGVYEIFVDNNTLVFMSLI